MTMQLCVISNAQKRRIIEKEGRLVEIKKKKKRIV